MFRSRFGMAAASAAALLIAPTAQTQEGLVVKQRSTYSIANVGHGDLRQTVLVRGADRQKVVTEGRVRFLVLTRDAGGTELVRLDRGRVYRLDDRRRQYQELGMEGLRSELERTQRQAELAAADPRAQGLARLWLEREPPQRNGRRRTINGLTTEHALLRMKVMGENARTGEVEPVFYLSAEVWLDPAQARATKVLRAFGDAFFAQLELDPRTAGNPYGRWLRELQDEIGRLEGFPILTNVLIEAAGEPVPVAHHRPRDRPPPADATANPVGAVLGGALRRGARPRGESSPTAPPGRTLLFSLSTEVLSISDRTPDAAEFEIPADYVER